MDNNALPADTVALACQPKEAKASIYHSVQSSAYTELALEYALLLCSKDALLFLQG